MPDWIDEEATRRAQGIKRPLFPSQHEAVNARYPSCTLQYCILCNEATGRCEEDTIWNSNGEPICEECNKTSSKEAKEAK